MASKYIPIFEAEFDEIFRSEKNWKKEIVNGSREFMYSKALLSKPWIVVKVYSSIACDGMSRGCGSDAIRVCAVNIRTNKGIIKTNRINRVPGWQDRLKNRVTEVWEQCKN